MIAILPNQGFWKNGEGIVSGDRLKNPQAREEAGDTRDSLTVWSLPFYSVLFRFILSEPIAWQVAPEQLGGRFRLAGFWMRIPLPGAVVA